jgi:hypothetical protein
MEIEFAFELIEDFITGVNMKILTSVRTAGDEGDEVRILPDEPSLSPVVAILVNPLL